MKRNSVKFNIIWKVLRWKESDWRRNFMIMFPMNYWPSRWKSPMEQVVVRRSWTRYKLCKRKYGAFRMTWCHLFSNTLRYRRFFRIMYISIISRGRPNWSCCSNRRITLTIYRRRCRWRSIELYRKLLVTRWSMHKPRWWRLSWCGKITRWNWQFRIMEEDLSNRPGRRELVLLS